MSGGEKINNESEEAVECADWCKDALTCDWLGCEALTESTRLQATSQRHDTSNSRAHNHAAPHVNGPAAQETRIFTAFARVLSPVDSVLHQSNVRTFRRTLPAAAMARQCTDRFWSESRGDDPLRMTTRSPIPAPGQTPDIAVITSRSDPCGASHHTSDH